MGIINLLLIASLASILLGQIIRIPLTGDSGAITPTDIVLVGSLSVFFIYSFFITRSIQLPKKITFFAIIFALWAFSTTVLASSIFSAKEILASSLFLARFILYFLVLVAIFNVVAKEKVYSFVKLILTIGLIFAAIGFVQYLTFPDLRGLTFYGWDPHQKRIVSTFLDPNFAGFVFVIFASIALSLFIFQKRLVYLGIFAIMFVAIILTFSRSSYLAFLASMLVIGIFKSKAAFLISLATFVSAFLFVSQARARIIGAFTLDETSQARLESWQNALTIFNDNPLFGVGFNTYRYAQARYGFFDLQSPLGGHSGAGSDSSILLVAATTGLIGLFFYSCLLFVIFKALLHRSTTSPLRLGALSSFTALIIHSQFVNSLFFPQIMLFMWFILGLSLKNDH